jgi:para-nitrobenzyl esterase
MAGQQNPVPVLIGFNRDELDGYLPPLDPPTSYAAYIGTVRKTFEKMGYANAGLGEGFASLLPKQRWTPAAGPRMLRGYMVTGWEMHSWASMSARASVPAFLYYFSHVPPGARGAFHTAEVSYVFNNEQYSPRYSPNMAAAPPRPSDLTLAETVSDYWVAFAKSGNPNGGGRPQWDVYGGDTTRNYLEFEDGHAQLKKGFFPETNFRSICEVLK